MRKMNFWMLLFFLAITASMNAQVLIGSGLESDANPTPGSVLDLQSGGSLGLLLPSVTLTSSTVWAPVEGSAVEGMAVFNNSDTKDNELTGKGIYVWVNGAWSRMGAPSTPCATIAAAAKDGINSFVGLGAAQTLEVVLSAGSGPYTYTWTNGAGETTINSNKSDYKDTYVTSAFGTYTCDITNACTTIPTRVTFVVSDVDEGAYSDPANQPTDPAIKWNLQGVNCFDVRAEKGFATSGQQSTVTLVVDNATVTEVLWSYANQSDVFNGTPTLSEGDKKITISYNTRAAIAAVATTPITVQVKALITMTAGSPTKTYKVVKTFDIKFQNASCCEGAIITGGAFDYKAGTTPLAGDLAKNGLSSTYTGDQTFSPNLDVAQITSASIWGTYFNTTPVGDLCVYYRNATNGSTTTSVYADNWGAAITGCASDDSKYIDAADAGQDWYLPNLYELGNIWHTLGGAYGSQTQYGSFASLIQAGKAETRTLPMETTQNYHSSTERKETANLNRFHFVNGTRGATAKIQASHFARCVRRL
jgi:hypothetical protein